MSEKTERCANPLCQCQAAMSTDYCCEYCETADHEKEIVCHCDHAECQTLKNEE